MDFLSVIARMNDLPRTFKREGRPYTQLIDAISRGLVTYTLAADAVSSQVLSSTAPVDGWLDVWGLLWGVPRAPNEANSTYGLRIQRTVLAVVGTVPAIEIWIAFYAPGGSVVENPSGLGYVITLPSYMSPAQVTAFMQSLNRIRPLGVPFVVTQIGSGLFLGTDEFLGTGIVMGSYLAGGAKAVPYPGGASTPNSEPILPTLLFSDPTINPASG